MSVFSANPYYHKSIESIIAAFGAFFSGIKINKLNDDGTRGQIIEVPIAYGPKNKWLERINARPDPAGAPNIQISVPRLSYEITDYHYDAERKIGYKGYYNTGMLNGHPTRLFNPVPYDVAFSLVSFTKDQGTALQILEQILPYFSPAITMTIQVLPEFNIMKDVSVVLKGVTIDDTYESGPDSLRTVLQTFSFDAKIDLFGPVTVGHDVIKQTFATINTNSAIVAEPATASAPAVVGAVLGAPTDTNTQTVVPSSANAIDNPTITSTWTQTPPVPKIP